MGNSSNDGETAELYNGAQRRSCQGTGDVPRAKSCVSQAKGRDKGLHRDRRDLTEECKYSEGLRVSYQADSSCRCGGAAGQLPSAEQLRCAHRHAAGQLQQARIVALEHNS